MIFEEKLCSFACLPTVSLANRAKFAKNTRREKIATQREKSFITIIIANA